MQGSGHVKHEHARDSLLQQLEELGLLHAVLLISWQVTGCSCCKLSLPGWAGAARRARILSLASLDLVLSRFGFRGRGGGRGLLLDRQRRAPSSTEKPHPRPEGPEGPEALQYQGKLPHL